MMIETSPGRGNRRRGPVAPRIAVRSALFVSSLLLPTTVLAQCLTTTQPTNDCVYGDLINEFSLAGDASGNGNACPLDGYISFAEPVRDLMVGGTHPWSATTGSGMYTEGLAIWIDLDNNGYYDTDEQLVAHAPALSHSGTLTIPAGTAPVDHVRMRVMATYNTVATAGQACSSNLGSYGETEDYYVNIVPTGLGVAKEMSVTGDGPYTVTLDYTLENFSDQFVESISVPDNLVDVFGAVPADWSFGSIELLQGPATFDRNPAYDGGQTDSELAATGAAMPAGTIARIRVILTLNTPGSYENQVLAEGEITAFNYGTLSDLSTEGRDPDPDEDGNPSEDTVSTLDAPGDCPPGKERIVLFSEDFEETAPGWVATPEGETWDFTMAADQIHSGLVAVHATDFGYVTDQRLTSPSIALPSGENPIFLKFWNKQWIEKDVLAHCYDGANLEISTDDGATFTQVTTGLLTDPFDGDVDVNYGNPLAGRDAWCGDPQPYLKSIVDLSAYAGQTVQLRFRLGTDASVGRDDGWNLDDVAVTSCSDKLLVDDFENGDVCAWPALCGATDECLTCGNGIVEAGEWCDDGNFASDDGCDGACLIDSCAGYCGSQPPGAPACYCDDLCIGFGDCCYDACTVCGYCSMVTAPPGGAGRRSLEQRRPGA